MPGVKNPLGRPHGSMAPLLLYPSEGAGAEDWLYVPSWIDDASGAFDTSGTPTGAAGRTCPNVPHHANGDPLA